MSRSRLPGWAGWLLLLSWSLCLAGCTAAAGSERAGGAFGFTTFGRSQFVDTDDDGLPDARIADAVTDATSDAVEGKPAALPADVATGGQRLRIYTGGLVLEVGRLDTAVGALVAKAQELGGFLHSRDDRTVTVRVPAAAFEPMMAAARALGRVIREQMTATDVTREFHDLELRLDNARRSRERLLALLAKADKVEDMLKIEEQLRRLTEEIERLEGEQRFLADQIALATIQVRFQAPQEPPPVQRRRASPFAWIRQVGAEQLREVR